MIGQGKKALKWKTFFDYTEIHVWKQCYESKESSKKEVKEKNIFSWYILCNKERIIQNNENFSLNSLLYNSELLQIIFPVSISKTRIQFNESE